MTVCLELKNSKKCWRYGNSCWSELKNSIIKSFFIFLENWIPLQSFVEGEAFEWSFCENLKELINDFKNIDNIYKINLNKFILLLETYIEPLSCFGFIGIYTLINKANGGAYYSCGNARDVYDLLEIINPYIDKEQDIYKHIIEAKDIFKYSHLSGEPICIA
jgi:hypothetical protein